MKSSVLVTGAAGFIGGNVVRRLVTEGFVVHALVRPGTNTWRIDELKEHIALHAIDIGDREPVHTLIQIVKPQHIFHFAAHGAYAFQKDTQTMLRTNVLGTGNLLEASKGVGCKSFINTSTSVTYVSQNTPLSEKDPLSPQSFYGLTKIMTTELSGWFANRGLPVITVCPFTVYGPYEEKSRFIPTLIRSIRSNTAITIPTPILRHDFIYIDDFVDACMAIVQHRQPLIGKVVNIGSGKEYTLSEVVETLFSVAGKTVPVEKGAYAMRPWDREHWVADISFIEKMTDWRPKTSLLEGLKKTYEWFHTHTTK